MSNHNKIIEINDLIEFEPIKHTYFYNGNYLISGTTFLKPFFEEFEKEKKLKKLYKNPEVRAWKRYEWDNSSTWGTLIHELLELYVLGYNIESKEHQFIEGKKLINEFLVDRGLELVGAEVKITNGVVAGTIDVLMYNRLTNKYVLLDYKTCNKIPKHSYNGQTLKEPFEDIEDTKFNKYSMQLSLYASILEDCYDVEIEDMYLLWIPKDGKGCRWSCDDLRDKIRRVL